MHLAAIASSLLLGCASLASAAPLAKRTPGDVATLQYALVLENLEATFYNEGRKKFNASDFLAAGFTKRTYDIFGDITSHENTHVETLQAVITSLNSTPLPACEYTFPYTDVKGFVAIARILENVGVSAYDGAINDIDTPALRTAAASIATIEARHASFLNYINKRLPIPTAFDSPLSMNSVVGLAASFIKKCPFVFPITALPALVISPGMGKQGVNTTVTLTAAGVTYGDICLSYNGAANYQSPITMYKVQAPNGNAYIEMSCTITSRAKGDVFLFIVKAGVPADFVVFGNEDQVVAGPALFQVIP